MGISLRPDSPGPAFVTSFGVVARSGTPRRASTQPSCRSIPRARGFPRMEVCGEQRIAIFLGSLVGAGPVGQCGVRAAAADAPGYARAIRVADGASESRCGPPPGNRPTRLFPRSHRPPARPRANARPTSRRSVPGSAPPRPRPRDATARGQPRPAGRARRRTRRAHTGGAAADARRGAAARQSGSSGAGGTTSVRRDPDTRAGESLARRVDGGGRGRSDRRTGGGLSQAIGGC